MPSRPPPALIMPRTAMTAAHRARPPPRDVPCPPAAQVYCFPPQTGDVRSLLPTLDMVTDHGHLPPTAT
ncbi:hypothetical protein FIBSPDRAFT_870940 [Athelia psychrophila]|uniref:Uncharacterized protein n=1 Tax=Athelia psychrophila TaxID=1759441 RepID=A0A166ANX0_9AGAM|nr:hypothetical protein FIBSPDRAFT_870940 [Fibularhizoctonia sp. CBS 109695]